MAERVIVIGAGMVGLACALRLQSAGVDTILIDPGPDERAASFGNAGHIAVEQVEPLASWHTIRLAPGMLFARGGPLDFRLGDVAAWGSWALEFMAAADHRRFEAGTEALTGLMARAVGAWTDLLSDIHRPDMIRADGHAVLWFDAAEQERGMRTWTAGRTGPATHRPLTQAELDAYRAVMPRRPPIGGLAFAGTARLTSPEAARREIREAFLQRGGRVVSEAAIGIDRNGQVRLASGVDLKADRILVAAGVRSGSLMRGLGTRTPLVAERGYSIRFAAETWPDHLPTAVIEGQSIVLAPQAEGLRATSYVEFARPDSPPDSRKWTRLAQRVRDLGFEVPDDHQRWMGCRPTLPDYLPAVGALEGGRVLYAFGHQHLGITLAAVTAEIIDALAREERPAPAAFSVGRFAR